MACRECMRKCPHSLGPSLPEGEREAVSTNLSSSSFSPREKEVRWMRALSSRRSRGEDKDNDKRSTMMARQKKLPDNQIAIYQTPDGSVNIEVMYAEENIWLSQKRMAELFEVDRSVVTKHLKNIFASEELKEDSVCANFAHTAEDGKTYQTMFYSLEAIIAVGYRVNSERGTQFRQWAISILQQYIHKGFAIDSDRFKYGSRFSTRFFEELLEEIREIRASERMAYQKITDIYATSVDYSPKAEDTKLFFAAVQNKLHFAITGKTPAEIISERADSSKPNMGLTS
jgi:hypothetical protein